MAEEKKVVTITVDGPRASGVTRIADMIASGKPLPPSGEIFPDYVVVDAGKERSNRG